MQKQQQTKIKEHSIVKLKISDLVFDPSNPNIMSDAQMKGLRKSMQKYGYLTPIVIDLHNKIADGEHRALIYKELGLKEISAIKMKLETDADRRELRQVLNKLHGFHDKSKDADELVQIFKAQKLDELTELIAQPKDDLLRLMLRYHPGLDFVTPENEADIDRIIDEEMQQISPNTKLGEIYELGKHRLICADCTDKRSIDKLFQDKKADLVMIDPPFGVDYSGHTEDALDFTNDFKDPVKYQEFISNILKSADSVLTKNGTLYLFHADKQHHAIYESVDESGYKVRSLCLWIKNNHTGHGFLYRNGFIHYRPQHEPILYCQRKADKWTEINWYGGTAESTVWQYDKPMANREHPTSKPVELYHKPIRNSSKENGIVFDPTVGSGSTLIACEQTNRICYACEIDPRYCDVVIRRWEKYTGNKAHKIQP